jgi:hypothetical protein
LHGFRNKASTNQMGAEKASTNQMGAEKASTNQVGAEKASTKTVSVSSRNPTSEPRLADRGLGKSGVDPTEIVSGVLEREG